MSLKKSIGALAFTFIYLVVVQYVSNVAANEESSNNKTIVADAEKVYPILYPLADLPVWSPDGETFNSSLVEAYLKESIGSNQWSESSSSMAAYSQNSSLVVATTSTNHNVIQDAIAKLRVRGVKPGTNK